jgi:hypothetical protein
MNRLKTLAGLLWSWLASYLLSSARRQTEIVEETQAQPKRAQPKRRSKPDPATTWHFRTSILDRLDEYFVCLQRLRRCDPDSYKFFSQIGFSIPQYLSRPDRNFLRDTAATRAAWGGVLFSQGDKRPNEDACIWPSFLYFRKLRRPSAVEPFRGDVYHIVALYDQRDVAKHWRSRLLFPVEYHLGIDKAGETHLLKERFFERLAIEPGRRGGRRSTRFRLRTQQWHWPNWLPAFAADNGTTAEDYARDMFAMILANHLSASSKLIVRVRKDNRVAAFGIDVKRTKYFFADRELTALATDGKRKRIFHSVRAHPRATLVHKPEVCAHYRGLRQFDWQGYAIAIVHPTAADNLMSWTAPAIYEEDLKPSDGRGVSSEEFGRVVDESLVA